MGFIPVKIGSIVILRFTDESIRSFALLRKTALLGLHNDYKHKNCPLYLKRYSGHIFYGFKRLNNCIVFLLLTIAKPLPFPI